MHGRTSCVRAARLRPGPTGREFCRDAFYRLVLADNDNHPQAGTAVRLSCM